MTYPGHMCTINYNNRTSAKRYPGGVGIPRILVCSLIVLILLPTQPSIGGAPSPDVSDTPGLLTSQDIIDIDGNDELNSTASSEGWAGNGSSSSPYLIQNLSIDANGGDFCIRITNTTLNFNITDCQLKDTAIDHVYTKGCGILLNNSRNALIRNISIQNCTRGISAVLSSLIRIKDVMVTGSAMGLDLQMISNSSFSNISMKGILDTGFEITDSSGCMMRDISVDSGLSGARVFRGSDNRFEGLYINARYSGMVFTNRNSSVTGCSIRLVNQYGNSSALSIIDSSGNRFVDNILSSPLGAGSLQIGGESPDNIFLSNQLWIRGLSIEWVNEPGADSSRLLSSTIFPDNNTMNGKPILYLVDNQLGGAEFAACGQVIAVNSSGFSLSQLIVSYCDRSVVLMDSHNISIRATRVFSGADTGILIHGSRDVEIQETKVYSARGMGLVLIWSQRISIEEMYISGGHFGLHVTGCREISVMDSDIINSEEAAVSLYMSEDVDINRTSLINGRYGLRSAHSSSITVDNCRINDNSDGVTLLYTEDFSMKGCDLENNTDRSLLIEYSNRTGVEDSHFRSGGGTGIIAIGSGDIDILDNRFSGMDDAVRFLCTDRSDISHNLMIDNRRGAVIEQCKWNHLRYNLFVSNINEAMVLKNSQNNWVQYNSFIQNNGVSDTFTETRVQVSDDDQHRFNDWYDRIRERGNHWSDLTGPDSNNDGIVDRVYRITPNNAFDMYPLVYSPVPFASPPRDLTAKNSSRSIELRWSYSLEFMGENLIGYQIFRGPEPDDLSPINQTPNFKLNYSDRDIIPGRTYYYAIRALTEYGLGESSNIVVGSADATSPSISFLYPLDGEWLDETAFYIRWEGEDPETGIDHYVVSLDREPWLMNGNETSRFIGPLTDGEHNIRIKGYNTVSEFTLEEISFNIDTRAPRVLFGGTGTVYTSEQYTEVQWTGSDPGGVIKEFRTRLNGGAWTAPGLSNETSITLDGGKNTFEVRVEDLAGNSAVYGLQIVQDTDPPQITGQIPDSEYYFNGEDIDLYWSASDTDSRVNSHSLVLDDDTIISLHKNESHYLLKDLEEGVHTYRLYTFDAAGNSAFIDWKLHVDRTPPEIVYYEPIGLSGESRPEITVTFSEEMSKGSVLINVMDVLTGDTLNGDLIWSDMTIIFTPRSMLEYGRNYQVTARGVDLAGNELMMFRWTISAIGGANISGKVYSAEGKPMTGILVRLDSGVSTRTDGSGNFRFLVPPGTYRVIVDHDNYEKREFVVTVESGQTADLSLIVLEETGALSQENLIFLIIIPMVLILIILVLLTVIIILRRKRKRDFEFFIDDERPKKSGHMPHVELELDEEEEDEWEIDFFDSAPDYYSILGVSRHSSTQDIKKAYRKLAYMYHPDKLKAQGFDLDAEDVAVMMRELNEAKDVLLDPTRRQMYDMSLLDREISENGYTPYDGEPRWEDTYVDL